MKHFLRSTTALYAPDDRNGGGGDTNLDGLTSLSGDGSADSQQDGVNTTDDLDSIIDQTLKDTSRGTTTTPKDGKTSTTDNRTQDNRQQSQADTDRQSTDGTAQHSRVPQTPRQIGAFFRTGSDGAIYDVQGNKVANSGLERRVAERVLNYYRGTEQENTRLKQSLDAYKEANAAAQKEGLSIEEHAMGMRLMAAWKKDPLQTMNFLLNQATQRGIDVSSIRSGGAAFDSAALTEAINAKIVEALAPFQPFVANLQRQQEYEEISNEVQQEIAAFFQEFPQAEQHRPILGEIMQRFDYSPREAWFALQASAASSGYDLTKPLPAQVASRNGANGGTGPTGGGRNPRIPPMGGRVADNGAGVRVGTLDAAPHDASWEDILQEVVSTLPVRQ